MKDRQPRTFGRKDGLVSRKLSGPVIRLDPTTMQPIDVTAPRPARINVTAKEAHSKKTKDGIARAAQGSLSWEEQRENIRRANSILLARAISKIDAGSEDNETKADLARCSAIAKAWTVEERNAPDADLTNVPTADLMKALK